MGRNGLLSLATHPLLSKASNSVLCYSSDQTNLLSRLIFLLGDPASGQNLWILLITDPQDTECGGHDRIYKGAPPSSVRTCVIPYLTNSLSIFSPPSSVPRTNDGTCCCGGNHISFRLSWPLASVVGPVLFGNQWTLSIRPFSSVISLLKGPTVAPANDVFYPNMTLFRGLKSYPSGGFPVGRTSSRRTSNRFFALCLSNFSGGCLLCSLAPISLS